MVLSTNRYNSIKRSSSVNRYPQKETITKKNDVLSYYTKKGYTKKENNKYYFLEAPKKEYIYRYELLRPARGSESALEIKKKKSYVPETLKIDKKTLKFISISQPRPYKYSAVKDKYSQKLYDYVTHDLKDAGNGRFQIKVSRKHLKIQEEKEWGKKQYGLKKANFEKEYNKAITSAEKKRVLKKYNTYLTVKTDDNKTYSSQNPDWLQKKVNESKIVFGLDPDFNKQSVLIPEKNDYFSGLPKSYFDKNIKTFKYGVEDKLLQQSVLVKPQVYFEQVVSENKKQGVKPTSEIKKEAKNIIKKFQEKYDEFGDKLVYSNVKEVIGAGNRTKKDYGYGDVYVEPKYRYLNPQILEKEYKGIQGSLKELPGGAKEAVVFGSAGIIRGFHSFGNVAVHPVDTGKGIYGFGKQLKSDPKGTATMIYKGLAQSVEQDPFGTVGEFYAFNKAMKGTGKLVKRSSVGRIVREQAWIARQPKNIRPYLRKIIKASKVQEKLKPYSRSDLKKMSVSFTEIQTLSKSEAKALAKAMKEADSLLFGSDASYILSGKKTSIPHDADIGVKNIDKFFKVFKKNIPKNSQKNYVLKGEKIWNQKTGQFLFDIKKLDRLYPSKDLLRRKGYLPVSGYKLKNVGLDKVKKISKGLDSKTPYDTLTKNIKKTDIKPLDITKFKNTPMSAVSDFTPTQKPVKVGGIKLTSFGEQTSRKGLGTIQVLIEKNVRRAKDPSSFIKSLQIQRDYLIKSKTYTPLGKYLNKYRIKKIDESLIVLSSKEFKEVLNQKVPGILKEYPLPKVKTSTKIKPRLPKKNTQISKIVSNTIKNSKTRSYTNKAIQKGSSQLSKIPTKTLSTIPSAVVSGLVASKLSKMPSSKLSSFPKSKLSKLPSSKLSSQLSKTPSSLKTSKLSKLPDSKLRTSNLSRLPPSKISISKTPQSKLSKLPSSKLSKLPGSINNKKKKNIVYNPKKYYKLTNKKVKGKKPEYLMFTRTIERPDKITSTMKLYTGAELR